YPPGLSPARLPPSCMTQISTNTGLEQPRLALLYQISREVSSRLDVTELLPRLLQLTLGSIAGHSGSLVVFDDQGRLRQSALLLDGQFHPKPDSVLQKVVEHGLAGWVVEHRETVYVPDIDAD